MEWNSLSKGIRGSTAFVCSSSLIMWYIARLPWEVVGASNLAVLKAGLDEALTAWSGGRCPWPWQGRVRTQWSLRSFPSLYNILSVSDISHVCFCHIHTCSSTMQCAEEILVPKPEKTAGFWSCWCCSISGLSHFNAVQQFLPYGVCLWQISTARGTGTFQWWAAGLDIKSPLLYFLLPAITWIFFISFLSYKLF